MGGYEDLRNKASYQCRDAGVWIFGGKMLAAEEAMGDDAGRLSFGI